MLLLMTTSREQASIRALDKSRPQLILKAYGSAVRKRRVSLGLSQEELANLASLHRTYIGGIERGERNPSLRNMEKIAVALKESLGSFFARSSLK